MVGLSTVRNQTLYETIEELATKEHYPIDELCILAKISRASYYKWLNKEKSESELKNEELLVLIKQIHAKHPEMGYRRIRDELEYHYKIRVNDKRVQRIMRYQAIKSNLKYRRPGCTKAANNPAYTAENILNRDFHADKPNEKWVTDVSEFKYTESDGSVHKLYLSAILDLCDRRPVSFVIGEQNNNQLVFETLDAAIAANPGAHPLIHSDRGFQYTSQGFHERIKAAEMRQSMSRVGHCTDNGAMEGFWGIVKREMYYGRRYAGKQELVDAITNYLDYYANDRPQRKLSVLTPMEYHYQCLSAA